MATMDCLPPHILQVILLKLPLLDVLRSMSVNKTWYSEANIVVRKRGTQLFEASAEDVTNVDRLKCCHPEHKKTDPSWILQVNGEKLKWEDMEYILKKMGRGLQVLNVFYHDKSAMYCAGDFTPNLECLQVDELDPPLEVLPYLKHLYGKRCYVDFLHRLDELFPSLEILNIEYLDSDCYDSRQARFRHGMTSISLPGYDLYEVSQWPALETLKNLTLFHPFCSKVFSFRAPLLEEFFMEKKADLAQEYNECLVRSLLRSHSIKNLFFWHSTIDVNLTKQLLSGLPQLINVSLKCPIDDEAISVMAATSQNIEVMRLFNTSVTDSTLEHLKNLPKLKKVSIRVTSMEGFTLKSLHKFCQEMREPDGKIRFDFGIVQNNLLRHSTEFNDIPNFRLVKYMHYY